MAKAAGINVQSVNVDDGGFDTKYTLVLVQGPLNPAAYDHFQSMVDAKHRTPQIEYDEATHSIHVGMLDESRSVEQAADDLVKAVLAEDGLPSQEMPISFTRIENGQAIHINGLQVGTNTVRRDYVKSKPTSRLRDKVANVWSVDFDGKALQTVFPAIQQQDLVRCFRSSSRDIRRLAAGDIQHMIQSLPSSTDLPA